MYILSLVKKVFLLLCIQLYIFVPFRTFVGQTWLCGVLNCTDFRADQGQADA